ncbi:transposase [Streptomyces africanus]|uniref:Transposase n=1 Tax=Streptomyces africanus TaxID=231024 RepID=A0ABU0R2L7_9ACTN|nr:transposase [Streptomyces africanus]
MLVAERVRVREIDDDEGQRLLRIIRRGSGSVVTWRRAQTGLLSAQGMPVAKVVEVTFTSSDRVRDVIHNFNADGFDSLYPKYKGGRPRTFTLPERREIKKIAKSRPTEHGLSFSAWSLAKLADFLVAEGVVDDISHEGLRVLLREEGVSFQRIKTWKTSRDPDYARDHQQVTCPQGQVSRAGMALPNLLAHCGPADRGQVHQGSVPSLPGPHPVHHLPRKHPHRGVPPRELRDLQLRVRTEQQTPE